MRLELATAVKARIESLTQRSKRLGQALIVRAGNHFLVDILGSTERAIFGDPRLLDCQKC